jgi:hypothetical protein
MLGSERGRAAPHRKIAKAHGSRRAGKPEEEGAADQHRTPTIAATRIGRTFASQWSETSSAINETSKVPNGMYADLTVGQDEKGL